jgi:hypothetical protein
MLVTHHGWVHSTKVEAINDSAGVTAQGPTSASLTNLTITRYLAKPEVTYKSAPTSPGIPPLPHFPYLFSVPINRITQQAIPSAAISISRDEMERPSSSWQGFDSLKPVSEKYKRIQLLFSSANFGYLETCAIESRNKHQPGLSQDVSCSIDLKRFASGFNNVALKIAFSDNAFWVARIPHQTLNESDKTSLLSEIATIKIIQQHTAIPIPQVFDFEMSADQPFGYPYMFMEYRGHSLPNGLAKPVPSEHRPKVAKQLANVFTELQNLTFSRIGRLWCGDEADQPVKVIAMDWHASPGPL